MGLTCHIKGGRILDPARGRDEIRDLFVSSSRFSDVPTVIPDDIEVLDASGMLIVPGFIDMHVHLREPGGEEAETVETGCRAAARGGFTALLAMPNTRPPVDNAARVKELLVRGERVPGIKVMASGCITAGREGKQLAALAEMAEAGVVAFTDDGDTVQDVELMKSGMLEAARLGLPVLDHALDRELAGDGVVHEGDCSARLGIPGIPSAAESRIVARDIELSAATGCSVHIQHVSAKESIDLIRKARQGGIPVSAEVTPHHLALSDVDLQGDDAMFKMNPPLRSSADRESLVAAVLDGVVSVLATDHAPHLLEEKKKGLIGAPFGVVGLETAVAVTYTVLVEEGGMNVLEWVRRWTTGPAEAIGLDVPGFAVGEVANFAVIDPSARQKVCSSEFLSRSRNTPFENRLFASRILFTVGAGEVIWRSDISINH